MPFIGRDWRSPGEAWVKTENLGWQRMKIIESQLYPNCNQYSACSWPPRSQFGQHMANNCNGQDKRPSDELNRNGSLSSASSSGCSSRTGSVSPTPLCGSPEKNVHHIHPIAISSPYGQHSCCSHPSDTGLYRSKHCETSSRQGNQLNAQFMTRSLSRESVQINPDKCQANKMRLNASVDDFRNYSSQETNYDIGQIPSVCHSTSDADASSSNIVQSAKETRNASSPILMENGVQIDGPDMSAPEDPNSNSEKSSQNHRCSICCCSISPSHNLPGLKEPKVRNAPHCRISVRTREVAMYNTISEAFCRLDFCNAIHDIRRFNYICKLLHLLITQNLTSLSGCATKVLFTMLEQVAWEVSKNKRNIHVLKNLLNELKEMIQKYYCWGRPIGSSLLWQQHFDTIERISRIVDRIELSPPKNETGQGITFSHLPVEMIREILLRLNDYRDLVNSAQASSVMRTMIGDQYIWEQLCRYHFTAQQLAHAYTCSNAFPLRKSSSQRAKYAGTTFADRQSSSRNIVERSSEGERSTQGHQHEPQSNHPVAHTSKGRVETSNPSHVTRAIKIFDKENSRLNLTGSDKFKRKQASSGLSSDSRGPHYSENGASNQQELSSDRETSEIDWELVFHKLRKKYDLKEEYADCLLLCRHCRCLFWKSFGHPCIAGEDPQLNLNQSIEEPNSASSNLEVPQVSRARGRASYQLNPLDREEGQARSRVSVAMLSRNFDNRVQDRNQTTGPENIPPISGISGRMQSAQRNRIVRAADRRPYPRVANIYDAQPRPPTKRDELVPKHVAITPQAFLKFFSL